MEHIRAKEIGRGANDGDPGANEHQAKNVAGALKPGNAAKEALQNPASDGRLGDIAAGVSGANERTVMMDGGLE